MIDRVCEGVNVGDAENVSTARGVEALVSTKSPCQSFVMALRAGFFAALAVLLLAAAGGCRVKTAMPLEEVAASAWELQDTRRKQQPLLAAVDFSCWCVRAHQHSWLSLH